jgi:type II secretory pathway pseudopilin PulG
MKSSPDALYVVSGVTLIELLITIVISTIALLALTAPFVAERSFWGIGKRQTEAQRDAQVALRAIARAAREGNAITTPLAGFSGNTFTFTTPSCPVFGITFSGDPLSGQLLMTDGCAGGLPIPLIDGVRSRVNNLVFTGITNKLVHIQLDVTHRLRTTDPNVQNELLQTEIFLRNAS